jgi:hypothetical protein
MRWFVCFVFVDQRNVIDSNPSFLFHDGFALS